MRTPSISLLSLFFVVSLPSFTTNILADNAKYASLLTIKGNVVTTDGKPIQEAGIFFRQGVVGGTVRKRVKTDENGRFQIPGLQPVESELTVMAKGLAPHHQSFAIRTDSKPLTITLKKGQTIRFRIVDKKQNPVAGAHLLASEWRGSSGISSLFSRFTNHDSDEEGRITWDAAPDEPVTYTVMADGFKHILERPLNVQDKEHVITLSPALKITGTVVEAKTKKPIKDFSVGLGSPVANTIYWDDFNPFSDTKIKDNHFQLAERSTSKTGYHVRVQAKGYKPAISRLILDDEETVSFDAVMEPSPGLIGTVLSPEGKPLRGARVVMCRKNDNLLLSNGELRYLNQVKQPHMQSDVQGGFNFDEPDDAFRIVVISDQGFACATSEDFKKSQEIKVTKWAQVQGKVMIGSKPAPGHPVFIRMDTSSADPFGDDPFGAGPFADNPFSGLAFYYKLKTKDDGTFAFNRVVPDTKIKVGREMVVMNRRGWARTRATHEIRLATAAGKTEEVVVGGTGRPVVGKITLPKDSEFKIEDLYWDYPTIRLRLPKVLPAGVPKPKEAKFPVFIGREGEIRVEDVPPGEYFFSVVAYTGKYESGLWRRDKKVDMLRAVFRLPLMKANQSDEALELGELVLGKDHDLRDF